MKITWIGHSCFKIESKGFSIVIDPYSDGSVPGLKPVREKANMVLCSHGHGDHNASGNVEIISGEENPFRITKIGTFHDDKNGSLRGRNTIHILDDGTEKIAHLGDLGCELNQDEIKELSGLNAVLIPVGGFYTIDGKQAAGIIRQIQPKFAIPMHFSRTVNTGISFGYSEIESVAEFLENFDSVKTIEGSSVETTEADAQIVVLHPLNV